MSKFLKLTDISGYRLLINKDLVTAVLTNPYGEQCRKIITDNKDISYYVRDSIDEIQVQLEED